jgi:15-cis-phytoene synthase
MQDSRVEEIITRQSKTNFLISFKMLPEHKREAINTVYAFCRCTDDIVDDEGDHDLKHARLRNWAQELERGFHGKSKHALLNKLSVIAKKFNIPVEHFYSLIHGMEMDLEKSRYESFDELHNYCYHVASTVGLMCSEIFGYRHESARDYAVNLGIALQLTNIVRDVRSDAEIGRIYLPHEDFVRFGYSEEELLQNIYNQAFINMMRFEVQRARDYYNLARQSLAYEDHEAFFAARIMDKIYFRILHKIEKKHYKVFDGKISISPATKLFIALREYYGASHINYITPV